MRPIDGSSARRRIGYRILLGLLLVYLALVNIELDTVLGRYVKVEDIGPEQGKAWIGRLAEPGLGAGAELAPETGWLFKVKQTRGTRLHLLTGDAKWSRALEWLNNLFDAHYPLATHERWSLVGHGGSSLHDEIRGRGEGLFSIWRGHLYFSLPQGDAIVPGTRVVLVVKSVLNRPVDLLKWVIPYLVVLTLAWLAAPAIATFVRSRVLSSPVIVSAAMSLVAVAGLLGVVELWTRRTQPFSKADISWPNIYHPVLGNIFKPGSTVRYTNGLDFWSEQRTNSLGFLDHEPEIPKPPGRFRIQLIGDSFVEAAQVPIEDKLASVLARHIRSAAGPGRVDIVATGYAGTGQANQLPYYTEHADRLRPDMLILMFVSNDFANNSSVLEAARNGWGPDHPPRPFFRPDGTWLPISADWRLHLLKGGTVPARAAELASGSAAIRQSFGAWDYTRIEIDDMLWEPELPPVFEAALMSTRHAFMQWKRHAEQAGVPLLVVSVDNIKSDHIPPSKRDNQFMRLRAMMDELGIEVLDLAPPMQKRGRFASARFRFDGHWNTTGHRWAADAIFEHFKSSPRYAFLTRK